MAKADKKFQVAATEWWKHLRPYNKRKFWSKVRKTAKRLLKNRVNDGEF